MQVILWKTKHSDRLFEATTEGVELDSYMKIFNEVLEQGDYECCPPEKGLQKKMFAAAKKGNRIAAKMFISLRKDYEYEYTELIEVE